MTQVEKKTGFGPPTRRTVVRTAAWTVPVIAVAQAAPAFALSPCAPVTLNWQNQTNGSVFSSAIVGGVTVTLAVTGATTGVDNRTVQNTGGTKGALGGQSAYLQLVDLNNANGTTQKISFGFSPSVANLSFSLLDIDSSTNTGGAWSDNVSFDTVGYTPTLGSQVTGTGGTGTAAYRANGVNTQVAAASTNGNVGITFPAAPLSAVTFNYFQSVAASGTPRIGVSNLTFRPILC